MSAKPPPPPPPPKAKVTAADVKTEKKRVLAGLMCSSCGGTVDVQEVADAAAKASDMGAAVGGQALLDNITVYQLTESGLALQATLKGTKYWQDDALNAAP